MGVPDFKVLLDVKATGSLSGAARRAGVAVSTFARRLDALETSLKLRLVDRRMNGARLTPDGERIAALAAPVVEGLGRVARAAAVLRSNASRDAVVVSATEFVIADVLAPALPLLLSSHPHIMVTLRSEAAVVSLAGRAADIAVRMSLPEGNSLVRRKLSELKIGLFASPAYLAGRSPMELDLGRERLLVYDDSYGRIAELDWVEEGGLGGAVVVRTNSTQALMNATIAGVGIGLLPAIQARAAGLLPVAAPTEVPARTAWALVHRDLRSMPAVRTVLNWIIATFNVRDRADRILRKG